ncbi:universal stress protein [Nocardia sp. NPDC101769]|uniref:universal stress protein n=1 Tax=Nocardia sp. NPDC101769 TaxID=3364333 RepID=UPI0037FE014E
METNIPTAVTAEAGPVVAGIDGSRVAVRAAEWAAAEAAARRAPLRLVSVVPAIDKPAFRPGGQRYREAHAALEDARSAILARHHAGEDADPPEISIAMLRGQADRVLVELSRSAMLIALGARDVGFLSHLVLGSTALAVSRDACCPVALVGRPAAEHGSILVVVGTWYTARAALLAGFRAARDRGTDVTVARVWQGRQWASPSDYAMWSGLPPDHHTASSVVPDAQLRQYQRDFPDVEVRPVTVVGDAATVVERLGATAQLVVIGHDPESARTARLGSLTQDLVRHAPCPVLVVPDPPGTEIVSRDTATAFPRIVTR